NSTQAFASLPSEAKGLTLPAKNAQHSLRVSGIDILEGVLRPRIGAVLRKLDCSFDDLLHLSVDLVDFVGRQLELRAQVLDRVLGRTRLFELFLLAVALRLADVVANETVRIDGEKHWSLASP